MIQSDKFNSVGFGESSDMWIFAQYAANVIPHFFQDGGLCLLIKMRQREGKIAPCPGLPWGERANKSQKIA